MSTESFLPLITKPTRIRDTSATLIDNIFTNVLPHPNSAIIISDISDHFPIFACFQLQRPISSIYRQTRHFTPDNIASLRSSLSQTDWSIIHNSHNADEAFGILNDTLISLLNEKIPLTKIKINNKCQNKMGTFLVYFEKPFCCDRDKTCLKAPTGKGAHY